MKRGSMRGGHRSGWRRVRGPGCGDLPVRCALPAVLALMLAACAGPQVQQSARDARTSAAVPPGTVASGAATGTGTGGAGVSAPGQAAPGATSRRGGYYLDDGPGSNPPVDLASIPDAVPRAEPLLPRTLRPYSVFGQQYTPMTRLEPFRQRGVASWYGRRYHGQPTSSGERYDMYAMTAAHPTLPIPSYVRVTHTGNGRSVVVRVNDRGPFLHGRVIDLSYTAAARLGYVEAGSAEVDVELITQFDGADTVTAAVVPPGPAPQAAPASAIAVNATAANVANTAAPAAEPLRLNVETVHASVPAAMPGTSSTEPAASTAAAASSAAEAPSGASASPALAIPPVAAAATAAAASPPAATIAAAPQRGFWLQFGAFHSLENARSAMTALARRLAWLDADFDIRQEGPLYKVQAGPWERREHAAAAVDRVRATTQLQPFALWR
jgi:rare lipoprotein A